MSEIFSAAFGLPTEEEGEEIVRQFGALSKHPREAIYTLCGNHDRNAPDEEEAIWFRKYIDPVGENSEVSGVDASRMPYPVTGTFERYYFDVGNIRILMMSDVNETAQEKGRGKLGGNPGGVVTRETFDWWVDQIETNHQDKIIISAHHYLLRETTVATGDWEGMKKNAEGEWTTDYHGYYAEGTPREASYLCWVGGRYCEGLFEKWLDDNPGKLDFWLGGHTHTNPRRHPRQQKPYRNPVRRRHLCQRGGINPLVRKGSCHASLKAIYLRGWLGPRLDRMLHAHRRIQAPGLLRRKTGRYPTHQTLCL